MPGAIRFTVALVHDAVVLFHRVPQELVPKVVPGAEPLPDLVVAVPDARNHLLRFPDGMRGFVRVDGRTRTFGEVVDQFTPELPQFVAVPD
jgi:hypothetical protein